MVRESFAAASPGSRLHVIPDGDEALRFLRRAGEYAAAPRPALILLDLNLPRHGRPGHPGPGQSRSRAGHHPGHRAVRLPRLAEITRAYARHANAYITKPRDLDGYDAVIKQIGGCFLDLVTLPPPAP
jgi:CheY-like chemotaxis protein